MILEENTIVAERFRLIRMIGRGGMGSVWHAFDTRLDIACALKFIEGELANVAEAHARFQREAKAAAALRSPHVVEIKDHGVWQGRPYIAMELLEGEDLGKVLAKAGGKLPPAQVNAIVQQVCRALTRAHQAGVVHRDLKPDNIFLVNDDDLKLVKILDFGVAKQTSQALDGSNTKTGAMLGTPYYMSPEQAQGIKSVDSRSDLWSLAVIVYQCITGRLPFESEALGDLLVKIIVHPIPVPSQIAHVPPGFDRWWAKAADRSPDLRFQSAKELGAHLEIALGSTSLMEMGAASLPHLQGTAIMGPSVTGSDPRLAVTPHPNAPPLTGHTAALSTAAFSTPHPGGPQGMGSHGAYTSSSSRPGLGTNPPTFAGVEPPASPPPKKGPSLALIAGIAAVALVGLGVSIVVARSSAASPSSPEPTTATPATPTSSLPEPAPEAVTELAPAEPAASAAPPAASVAPPAAASVATPTAAAPTAVKPTRPKGAGAAKPQAAPATSAAAPTAPAKKTWDPGF